MKETRSRWLPTATETTTMLPTRRSPAQADKSVQISSSSSTSSSSSIGGFSESACCFIATTTMEPTMRSPCPTITSPLCVASSPSLARSASSYQASSISSSSLLLLLVLEGGLVDYRQKEDGSTAEEAAGGRADGWTDGWTGGCGSAPVLRNVPSEHRMAARSLLRLSAAHGGNCKWSTAWTEPQTDN